MFDHIAACIADFLDGKDLKTTKLPVGFTFSFPCLQETINVAKLISWTKGFNASDVIGNNVVQLLHEACLRRKVKILIIIDLSKVQNNRRKNQ